MRSNDPEVAVHSHTIGRRGTWRQALGPDLPDYYPRVQGYADQASGLAPARQVCKESVWQVCVAAQDDLQDGSKQMGVGH